MSLRCITARLLLACFAWGILPAVGPIDHAQAAPILAIAGPADAVSVRLPRADAEARVRYHVGATWSSWESLRLDGDGEPGDRESDLAMFPVTADALEVSGVADPADVHPITVSREPVSVREAAIAAVAAPRIISRSAWGADTSYLFDGSEKTVEKDLEKGDIGAVPNDQPSQRVKDCQAAITAYPDEFSVKLTVKKDAAGRTYRWPLSYSKAVKLLVVHHTALLVQGDPRPAAERVRALYKYHAVSKGWGDIGYHYVVDEEGRIYEGRTGGEGVVGGHAYCNNVGTIGIVLLGNFEIEQPTQRQVQSLQWLLSDLADTYRIDLGKSVQFHGEVFASPVVRHRDLLSTLCPGHYLTDAFGQIVRNVQAGTWDAPVLFPVVRSSSVSSSARSTAALGRAPGIAFMGRTGIAMNPGGKQRVSIAFTAGPEGAYEGKKIADVRLSSTELHLRVDDGETQVPVTKGILLPFDLPAGETLAVQLIVQAPIEPGAYWMEVGGIRFEITVSGRRARTGAFINPFSGNPAMVVQSSARSQSSMNQLQRSAARRTQSASSAMSSSVRAAASSSAATENGLVRIRLSTVPVPTVTFQDAGTVGNVRVAPGTAVELQPVNGGCEARVRGERLTASDVLRLRSSVSDTLLVNAVRGKVRTFRGTIECRMIDSVVALINELPLEQYLEGLSEEPDSEPYEKQRAFAVAARTYAAYYASPVHRKFPGKPYDGSDDPAFFQSYSGVEFAGNNPNWVRAVRSTASQVLSVGGEIIRPPYFTSDAGRTRSPEEAGWKNFPFAEVFRSKDDPWCIGKTALGHGVGMSGCGAKGQALGGRSAEQILQYYYPGTRLTQWP